MFLLVSSSRKPVIDPTKPLPPQATFLGPYINTGSRDVGPDVGPQKKWSKFSYLFKLIYIYAHCLRLKFLYLSLVYRDFEGNYGWEFFSVRGVLQSVCMVYVNFSSLNKKKRWMVCYLSCDLYCLCCLLTMLQQRQKSYFTSWVGYNYMMLNIVYYDIPHNNFSHCLSFFCFS